MLRNIKRFGDDQFERMNHKIVEVFSLVGGFTYSLKAPKQGVVIKDFLQWGENMI
jgi:hypothetical protein